jgi:putative ABC transport system permease protein
VMQIPIVSGRDFGDTDTPLSPKVALVNQTFARSLFGEASPLGRTFVDGNDRFEVVGIVGDSKVYGLREEFRPIAYTAASQVPAPGLTIRFVLRSRIGVGPVIEGVKRTLSDFDPSAAVRFATLDALSTESLFRERLMASLSAFFGAIALALAAVGVYGAVSYTAASRRREIGIRLALGARATHVFRTVLGRMLLIVGAGVIVGLGLALSASAAVGSLLYGVEPGDPVVLVAIAGIIIGAALVAAVIPARRAVRLDPVQVLKME